MKRQLLILFLTTIGLTSCIKNKAELILAADREAPIGWVTFKAYSDKTFEYSLSREQKFSGTYKLHLDTLFLFSGDTSLSIDTVIIRENSLEFLGKKSPRFATISINKITK